MLADLIPASFFESLDSLWLWLMAAGAIALLVFGADRAVSAAVTMARALGMSTVIIGATVVSLGTTAPETAVSVSAAFQGQPGLALGNGIGSVICNMALIFGLCACLRNLPKDRFVLKRQGLLQFGSAALLIAIATGLAVAHGSIHGVTLPRVIGIIFLAVIAAYLVASIRWARQHPDALPATARPPEDQALRNIRTIALSVLLLGVGLAMVIGGAQVMVGSVSQLCLRYGVPPNVLAVTLIAFGTSLPELVTAIMAVVRGHPELLVGNVVGANILNVLFVIGASNLAARLEVPTEFYYLHFPIILAVLGLFTVFIFLRGKTFRRWQGAVLVTIFLGYYATLLVLVSSGVLATDSP
jgi:cation:H+ antiporter